MKQTAAVDVKVMKFNISRNQWVQGITNYLRIQFWVLENKKRKTMIKKSIHLGSIDDVLKWINLQIRKQKAKNKNWQ